MKIHSWPALRWQKIFQPVCFSPSWVNWLNFVEKVLGQYEQAYPFSPRWTTLMCARSLTFEVSLFPHSSQGHSFLLLLRTPCLRALWHERPFEVENRAGQYPQRNGLLSSMCATWRINLGAKLNKPVYVYWLKLTNWSTKACKDGQYSVNGIRI